MSIYNCSTLSAPFLFGETIPFYIIGECKDKCPDAPVPTTTSRATAALLSTVATPSSTTAAATSTAVEEETTTEPFREGNHRKLTQEYVKIFKLQSPWGDTFYIYSESDRTILH
jgi:hypothetical protein